MYKHFFKNHEDMRKYLAVVVHTKYDAPVVVRFVTYQPSCEAKLDRVKAMLQPDHRFNYSTESRKAS